MSAADATKSDGRGAVGRSGPWSDGDRTPMPGREHRPPRDCPVCGHHLATTRLGCTACGTEVAGLFTASRFCGLSAADEDVLRVFLVSRGNMKELARHLQVSYPTARLRFAELLERIGFQDELAQRREDLLRQLAAGEIEVDEAERLLAQ